jgi:hypothetical protein
LTLYIGMSLNPQPAVHEIRPGEGYDIDSDEFESDDEGDMIPDDEYDQLMEEGMFSSPPLLLPLYDLPPCENWTDR